MSNISDLRVIVVILILIIIAWHIVLKKVFYFLLGYRKTDFGVYKIEYSKLLRRAFILDITWNGSEECTRFDIPDYYENCKIIGLGHAGTPFEISLGKSDRLHNMTWYDKYSARELGIKKSSDCPVLEICISFGKYIREISPNILLFSFLGTETSIENNADTIVVYKIKYSFKVDENNKYFKAKRGVLYYEDGEKVEEFEKV